MSPGTDPLHQDVTPSTPAVYYWVTKFTDGSQWRRSTPEALRSMRAACTCPNWRTGRPRPTSERPLVVR